MRLLTMLILSSCLMACGATVTGTDDAETATTTGTTTGTDDGGATADDGAATGDDGGTGNTAVWEGGGTE